MFEAIRAKLIGAWKEIRSKGLVTLFFFELLVVTLGVLLAQKIADLSEEREAYREMEAERQVALDALRDSMTYVIGWKVVIPCIDDRMSQIMLSASQGQNLPPKDLKLPAFYGAGFPPMSDRSLRLLVERHGSTEASELNTTASSIARIRIVEDHIIENWEALGQIDASNGAPSPLDRQQARKAASSIKTSVFRLNILANNVLDSGRILGLKANPKPVSAGRPVANCEEFWRIGKSHFSPDVRNPDFSRKGI